MEWFWIETNHSVPEMQIGISRRAIRDNDRYDGATDQQESGSFLAIKKFFE